MAIRVMLVDDEAGVRLLLKKIIEIVGASGLDFARIVADIEPKTKIIFATAHGEFMPQAFEVYAFDYLVKPFDMARVNLTLDRVISLQNGALDEKNRIAESVSVSEKDFSRLLIKGKESASFVDTKDIVLIQRESGNTVINTKN